MAGNVQSAMLEILKKIRADVADTKGCVTNIEGKISEIKGRLDRIEATSRKQERNNAGLLVMMQATVGRFEERVSSLEAEVLRLKEAE